MKENNYVLHTKNGVQLVTESQAVNNALEQEKAGFLRVMRSGIIRPAKISRRPAGLYGQLMKTGAGLFTVAQMVK